MEAIEIAQRLAELNQNEEALRAYKLALQDQSEKTPGALMNAALHILQFGQGDDYQISYTLLLRAQRQAAEKPLPAEREAAGKISLSFPEGLSGF